MQPSLSPRRIYAPQRPPCGLMLNPHTLGEIPTGPVFSRPGAFFQSHKIHPDHTQFYTSPVPYNGAWKTPTLTRKPFISSSYVCSSFPAQGVCDLRKSWAQPPPSMRPRTSTRSRCCRRSCLPDSRTCDASSASGTSAGRSRNVCKSDGPLAYVNHNEGGKSSV